MSGIYKTGKIEPLWTASSISSILKKQQLDNCYANSVKKSIITKKVKDSQHRFGPDQSLPVSLTNYVHSLFFYIEIKLGPTYNMHLVTNIHMLVTSSNGMAMSQLII